MISREWLISQILFKWITLATFSSHQVMFSHYETERECIVKGTTGKPKGVTLSHHNLVNNAHNIGYRIGYNEKVWPWPGIPTNLHFDQSLYFSLTESVFPSRSTTASEMLLALSVASSTAPLMSSPVRASMGQRVLRLLRLRSAPPFTAPPQCLSTSSPRPGSGSRTSVTWKPGSWQVCNVMMVS